MDWEVVGGWIGLFEGLPIELAVRVDRLSAFGAFRRIALPLAAPGTATAAALAQKHLVAGRTAGATKG